MDEIEIGVLVAVGPDGIGDGALDVAAAEAVRMGAGVGLLHVVHSLVPVVPEHIDEERSVDRALTAVGRDALTDAAERLRTMLDGRVPISTEIVFGPVSRTIVERGNRTRMIVMEVRAAGAVERMITRSVSSAVSAHAEVPVMVVPPAWSPGVGYDLPVTVGVEQPLDAKLEVPFAIEHARATGRPLVVLHAAWLAEPYQGVVFSSYPRQRWLDDAHRELEGAMAGLATGVELTCDVRWARPVEALVKATLRSSVLVLNRRLANRPLAAHLGPITRGVLHHAECPVLVVDRAH